MVDKATLGAGNVPIVLDGEEYVLRPTLGAALFLVRQPGGLQAMSNRIFVQIDLDAATTVVQHGLGYPSRSLEAAALPDKVWRTGLTDGLAEKCVLYLRVLAGGGQLPAEARDDTPRPPRTGVH
jgi:hypothetical protein